MIILDENVPESQCRILRSQRIRFRQIGVEVGRKGLKDNEIIPLIFQLQNPTFFSLDSDFYYPKLCHLHYCLVYVDVDQYEAAFFIRRLLRHREYNTYRKRRGKTMRISHQGISIWCINAEKEEHTVW